jgi:hypothetical protein
MSNIGLFLPFAFHQILVLHKNYLNDENKLYGKSFLAILRTRFRALQHNFINQCYHASANNFFVSNFNTINDIATIFHEINQQIYSCMGSL